MKALLTSIAVIVAFLGWSSAAPVPKDKPNEAYFPKSKGTKWVWSFNEEFEFTEIITAVEQKPGGTVISVSRQDGKGPDKKVIPWDRYSLDADGVRRTWFRGSDYEPPLLLLQLPFKADSMWEAKSEWFKTEVIDARHAIKQERVRVPAGAYEAVRVEAEYTNQVFSEKGTYWYARGVGLIKLVLNEA